MNSKLIQNLNYSYPDKNETFPLPLPLQDSLRLISKFFVNNRNNKLCLILPAKEFSAQWLSIPLTFDLICSDFISHHNQIAESYKQFKPGDKLLLNNMAVVEWVGTCESNNGSIIKKQAIFKTKSTMHSDSFIYKIPINEIIKLQKTKRKVLSPQKAVLEARKKKFISPIEKLLEIETYGNMEFIQGSICLVTKYISFTESVEKIYINNCDIDDYLFSEKIKEGGTSYIQSPLLIVNNLANLSIYPYKNPISKIIVDGFSAIKERMTDFIDIDTKNIPTILITDLSEIESFDSISKLGFCFFNFTKKYLKLTAPSNNSPFHLFDTKLCNYRSFKIVKEICQDKELDIIARKIYYIENDESDHDLNSLKFSLIELSKHISRISHLPTPEHFSKLKGKLENIENVFSKKKIWIGDSQKAIEEVIILLKSVIDRFSNHPTEKCVRLKSLMDSKQYNYIICSTDAEALALANSFSPNKQNPTVITIAEVNDKIISNKDSKVILTGWVKSGNINQIISSFLFSELILLFYQFENGYFNSLITKDKELCRMIQSTITDSGTHPEEDSTDPNNFNEIYLDALENINSSESDINILDIELRLNKIIFSKYITSAKLNDSIKVKRVDFENNTFLYSTETHHFLVINDLIDFSINKPTISSAKLDKLRTGDIIAFINTDKDVLTELVRSVAEVDAFESTSKWIKLWKDQLEKKYYQLNSNFQTLYNILRVYGCVRTEATVRNWLFNENLIGPESDSDLIIIANLTDCAELKNNISKVRIAITQMVSWRMRAADKIRARIKNYLSKNMGKIKSNILIDIPNLGTVSLLCVLDINQEFEWVNKNSVHKLFTVEQI